MSDYAPPVKCVGLPTSHNYKVDPFTTTSALATWGNKLYYTHTHTPLHILVQLTLEMGHKSCTQTVWDSSPTWPGYEANILLAYII